MFQNSRWFLQLSFQHFHFKRCTRSLTHKECATANRFRSILPPVISGQLRAKVPLGDWLYPVLLLEPHYIEYNMHFDYGQMRIAFTRGNRELEWNGSDIANARLYGGVVLTEATEFLHQSMVNVAINAITDRQQNFGGAFHIYSLTWTPDELILNFYITLGLGAGGHGDFPNDVQKPWQNTAPQAQFKLWKQRGEWIPTLSHPILEVDYVRICAV
uniref:GH16 domain-containing protein n=1 Tax=Glossina morsitans morsitans TaxID=37546 RepID=A0A1B0GD04_GLOMM